MENNYEYVQQEQEKKGSVMGGILGAVLGALVGAVLWCLVAVVTEHIYAIIGFVLGLIIGFGYDLLKGRKGILRIITVFVCVLLSVVCGTVGAYAWWMHESYVEETEFIATASKEELAEAYLSAEELAELNSYPTALKRMALETLEVTMPEENEYFQLLLQDSEFTGEVIGECGSSIFFALLGSFALILNGGKKNETSAKAVEASANLEAASVQMASVPEQKETSESDVVEESNT